jgi:hypothetical protein
LFKAPAFRGAALCAALLFAFPYPSPAAQDAIVTGMIVDRATGLPLAGATVSSEPRTATVTTDNTGHFSMTLAPGTYRLEARKDGYQPAVTGGLHPVAGQTLSAILALQRGESDLSIIATATSRASAALRTSTTFYRTLNVERLQRDGTVRAADALRALPGVNNGITGDTGTFADDVNLNIRGLGTLETQATLDGHAIGYGFPGGYNYNLSPVFALRNIEVVYGSGGSTLTGVDAIGGVVDFQTLDPTPRQQLRVMQGIGSFQNAVSTLSASGTSGRFGYAAAYGVSTIDGPVQNAYLYQPGAAYDQSASAPAVRDLGIYKDDSTAVSRSGLAKVSYDAAPRTRVSFTTLASSIWDDKTGNGDGDYLAYPQALAFGKHLLAVKSSNDPCGSGTFTGTNANGVPNGSGPGGMPDGGTRCQTPEQWARFNAGYQGAGPSWQSFNLQDEDLAVATDSDRRSIRADLYVSRFAQTFDRTWQLPFKNAPGDRANWRNRQVVESGASISDDLHLGRNDLGFGFSWMNDAYLFTQKGLPAGAPIVHETAFFLRDAYHPSQKLYAYANAWFKHASETNSSYVDSRLSLAYAAGSNDVARYAVGTTTAQPSADMLGKTFVESPPGNAGGGASITCSGLNSIGTAPSSVLRPERGVDQELAYGHRFSGDSQVQLSLYNVDVFDKLYSTLQPLGAAGGSIHQSGISRASRGDRRLEMRRRERRLAARHLGHIQRRTPALAGHDARRPLALLAAYVRRLRLGSRFHGDRGGAAAAARRQQNADPGRATTPASAPHARPRVRPYDRRRLGLPVYAAHRLRKQHKGAAAVQLQRFDGNLSAAQRRARLHGEQPLQSVRRRPRVAVRRRAVAAQRVCDSCGLRARHRGSLNRAIRSAAAHALSQLHGNDSLIRSFQAQQLPEHAVAQQGGNGHRIVDLPCCGCLNRHHLGDAHQFDRFNRFECGVHVLYAVRQKQVNGITHD